MLVNDPETFSFVLSTRNRPAYVRRTVEFLRHQSFSGSLLVLDASDDALFVTNGEFLAEVSDMLVRHFQPTRVGNIWTESAEACETISSRYVLWHHDDDFYFNDAVETALQALERDPGAACAQGREVAVKVSWAGSQLDARVVIRPRFAYRGASRIERLQEAFSAYCHLFFAVVRREVFVEACRLTTRYLEEAWFDQFAWSIVTATRGRALLTDQFFGIRQKRLGSRSMQFRIYDLWPMLAANPQFSKLFANFKACLVEAVGEGDEHHLRQVIDRGLVSLIGRYYGYRREPDVVDQRLIQTCVERGTPEWTQVASIMEVMKQHPETV